MAIVVHGLHRLGIKRKWRTSLPGSKRLHHDPPSRVRYLQENSQEAELLFKKLLIGVTHFFRDPEAWARLQQQVIPALLADRPTGGRYVSPERLQVKPPASSQTRRRSRCAKP